VIQEVYIKANLVDTGSPVTIVSIDCILNVLKEFREPEQLQEERKQEIWKKFETLRTEVNNYIGGLVYIISQQ